MTNYGPAKVIYGNNDIEVVGFGDYVICAVSGEKIKLDDLAYWSVARQEAYASCSLSHQRELELNPHMRKVFVQK